MLHRTAQSLLIALCCALVLGPQFFLQLGAWGWMVGTYAQEDGIEQAIRETFNGERPCELCKIIQATETSEQPITPNQADSKQRDLQLILLGADTIALMGNAESTTPRPEHGARMIACVGEVPVPPPRAA